MATIDRIASIEGAAMNAKAASASDGDGKSGMCRMERHGLGHRYDDDADADDKGKKLTHFLTLMFGIDVSPLRAF